MVYKIPGRCITWNGGLEKTMDQCRFKLWQHPKWHVSSFYHIYFWRMAKVSIVIERSWKHFNKIMFVSNYLESPWHSTFWTQSNELCFGCAILMLAALNADRKERGGQGEGWGYGLDKPTLCLPWAVVAQLIFSGQRDLWRQSGRRCIFLMTYGQVHRSFIDKKWI